MQVSDANPVVLVVELEEQSIEALCRVVDRAWISRVEDIRLLTAGELDIDVAFRDLAARIAIAVDAHSAEVTQMDVKAGFDDGAKNVVSAAEVVVNSVALALRRAHRVRGRTLLSEVDNGVRLLVLKELEEHVVLLLDVNVVEGDFLATDLLPGRDTNFWAFDRRERSTA